MNNTQHAEVQNKGETQMLNINQKTTILSYINYCKPEVKKYLRGMQALNNNNTLRKWDNHKWILNWFLTSINQDNYEVEDNIVFLEISEFDSRTGNPVLFDFPAREFNLS